MVAQQAPFGVVASDGRRRMHKYKIIKSTSVLSAQFVDVHFRLPFPRVTTCTNYPVGGASRAVPVGAGADMIARIDMHCAFLLFSLGPIFKDGQSYNSLVV